ncbi:helix-turn-helix domain-containing protein [Actinoplanes sp. NPDC020271]|uniref:helix-turn-helix domain-containing protein n=1 Tax=Actinoplanes sp. NPDC020271 TaxID=3363896 RepID=UPI0037B07178
MSARTGARQISAVEVADRLAVAPSTAFQILHCLSGYGLVRRIDGDLIRWEVVR